MGARPRAKFEINPSHMRIQHRYWAISAASFFKTGMNLVHFGMNFVLKRMKFIPPVQNSSPLYKIHPKVYKIHPKVY